MKKVFEKMKPGSSKKAVEKAQAAQAAKDNKAAEAAMAEEKAKNAKAVKPFLDKVGTLVEGTDSTGTGDEHIRDLARTIGPAIFSVSIGGAVVQNCWVGPQDELSNKVQFALTEPVFVPKVRIPSAVVVRTIQADKLDIEGSNGNLESFKFKNGDYTTVDLARQTASCLFVLTTQLTGCSFVIGCRGTELYMGHAQRHPNAAFGKTGPEVAASLKLKRQTMFQGLEDKLESTFLVGAGSEFRIDQSDGIITYNVKDSYLNVIGLVCNGKFYCILATKSSEEKIKDVVLVTLDTTGTRKSWETEEMPKTW